MSYVESTVSDVVTATVTEEVSTTETAVERATDTVTETLPGNGSTVSEIVTDTVTFSETVTVSEKAGTDAVTISAEGLESIITVSGPTVTLSIQPDTLPYTVTPSRSTSPITENSNPGSTTAISTTGK